jgi:hypothetical protein
MIALPRMPGSRPSIETPVKNRKRIGERPAT